MATLKVKKPNENSRYPQFPILKSFFIKFINGLTGVDPTERMIYGLKKDKIEKNNSDEVDATGNCLLETLFYLTDPNKCDGLSEDVCKIEKNTFSREKRIELVKKFNEVNKDPEKNTIDTYPLNKIVKSSTYLGPESLKLFALIFNCSFLVFVLLPGDIAINYYCNTNPSKENTYVLLLKGATGQHFIPLVRKIDPQPFVLKALTRVAFRLFEGQDQITEDYRLKKHMDVFKRGQLEDTSRILELTCSLDELKSKLKKYIPKVKSRLGGPRLGQDSESEPESHTETKGKPRIGLGLGLRSEPDSDDEGKGSPRPRFYQEPETVEPLPEPEPEPPKPEPEPEPEPPKPKPRPRPPLPRKLLKASLPLTSPSLLSQEPSPFVPSPLPLPSPPLPSQEPSVKKKPPKLPSRSIKHIGSKENKKTHNENRNLIGVYLPKANSNTNNNTIELNWRLRGKGQTRKEFRNKRNLNKQTRNKN
jgi:hypothetical protein